MSKSFCGGVLCRESDRKFKCIDCKRSVCTICSVKEGKKLYCIDCYLKSFSPNWEKLNKEFSDMLETLNKKEKSTKNKYGVDCQNG